MCILLFVSEAHKKTDTDLQKAVSQCIIYYHYWNIHTFMQPYWFSFWYKQADTAVSYMSTVHYI